MKCASCGRDLQEGVSFCPYCGEKVAVPSASAVPVKTGLPSTATVEGRKGMSSKAKAAYSSIGLLLLVGMGVAFVNSLPGGEHPVIHNQPTVSSPQTYDGVKLTMIPVRSRVENGFIIISLTDVLEKKMVGFTYEGKTKKVELMAYVNPQGKLVTSIAMCDPCNSQSFHTESKELVCDNCGTRWNFSNLEGVSGSCQKYPPDPIPSEIVNGEIKISTRLVEDWKLRI